jgi:tetratricopeptide (TPR) repeat protein
MLAFLAASGGAREVAGWNRAATPHFDIYSNADPETLRSLALNLERLHAFFVLQVGIGPRAHRQVRVICFASAQEYSQYRARPGVDAFYIGAEDRDYIVLPAVPRADLRVAAHEYAHVLIHSGGWTLPEWIAEGIGDVVSTVQMRDRESQIGGDTLGRSQALKNGKWMTLPELFAFTLKGPQSGARSEGVFYAQSWALTDLLMLSPTYRAGFPALLAALASGVPAERALDAVYHTPLAAVERDLRARVARGSVALPLRAVGESAQVRVEPVTSFASRVMLADLRLANGDLAAAASTFQELAAERPASGEVLAAIGAIALKRGETGAAVAAWKRAVELNVADADLCYRYAVLADQRGLSARNALERALTLRPDFDDARFKLALLEKNAGHAEAAVTQLRAMRQIGTARAFAYWSSMADALLDLDRRAEAKQAAAEAHAHAAGDEERQRAAELSWLADTELAVEIDGQKFHTVRVPVGSAQRNPFIEAGDRVQRTEATMRQVDCPEGGIQLVLDTAQGALTLAIPDPSRVQIRNAGSVAFEFVCGPQQARRVLVEYAPARSIVRGLEFR